MVCLIAVYSQTCL